MNRTFKAASAMMNATQETAPHITWGQRFTSIPRMLKAAFTGQWKDANRIGLTAAERRAQIALAKEGNVRALRK